MEQLSGTDGISLALPLKDGYQDLTYGPYFTCQLCSS